MACIVGTDGGVEYTPCQEVNPCNLRMRTECSGQLHYVACLAARIGIPAELEVLSTDQSMDADKQ